MKPVYLDNAATTALCPEALEAVTRTARESVGNPSSLHRAGVRAAAVVERARAAIAARIGARPDEIVFTSGGTEANNLALAGCVPDGGGHIVVSAVEHASILNAAAALERRGTRVTMLPVDGSGLVSPDDVRRAVRPDTVLVSVMLANNEIGTIEPIAEIGRVCRERDVLFHTDACQGFMKVPLDVGADCADLVSLNAHKLHGPRGVGALYVRSGTALFPLFHGGGQEQGLRPGTLNIEGVAGFAAAVEAAGGRRGTAALRDELIGRLEELGARLTGPRGDRRLCTNVNAVFPAPAGVSPVRELSRRGVMASAGSACSAAAHAPSHVLAAVGLSPGEARCSVRFSLSRFSTREDILRTVVAVRDILKGGPHEERI